MNVYYIRTNKLCKFILKLLLHVSVFPLSSGSLQVVSAKIMSY